jgi:hypothetical protein
VNLYFADRAVYLSALKNEGLQLLLHIVEGCSVKTLFHRDVQGEFKHVLGQMQISVVPFASYGKLAI